MHPGPMNRGVEIASEVADGPYPRSSNKSPTVGRPHGGAVIPGRRSGNTKRLLKVAGQGPGKWTRRYPDILIDGDRIAKVGLASRPMPTRAG